MSDRTVHAAYDGMEIVRYNRVGKWYLEPTDKSLPRQRVRIADAANQARWGLMYANGSWTPGLSGGRAFDRRMQ